ncbi:hypothetical protein CSKR_111256 [Clonorchis sinensis]|uniref:CWH43-like N-terminal domain-containing protein n=1 Tax=Clonorchis sinensis TaxID=79923 RepID=A0A3R7D3S0_CLOSI|nr:hypothetical protein CSKR_111256 [Clonorchis sinensis]
MIGVSSDCEGPDGCNRSVPEKDASSLKSLNNDLSFHWTAFSWFSATEYGIAIANMGFHMTAAYDFQDLMLTTTLKKPYSE